jgi:hypothetical protein
MLQCGCGGVRSERVEAAAERRSVRERAEKEREGVREGEGEGAREIDFFFLSFFCFLFILFSF